MAALKMGVYTPQLELVGLLESFKSLIFQEQAFAAGSFTVDCPMTPTVRRLLSRSCRWRLGMRPTSDCCVSISSVI